MWLEHHKIAKGLNDLDFSRLIMNLIKLAVKSIKEDLSASNVVNVFGEASQAPIGFSAENKKLPRKKTVCYVERGGEKGDGCLLAKSRIVFKGLFNDTSPLCYTSIMRQLYHLKRCGFREKR